MKYKLTRNFPIILLVTIVARCYNVFYYDPRTPKGLSTYIQFHLFSSFLCLKSLMSRSTLALLKGENEDNMYKQCAKTMIKLGIGFSCIPNKRSGH